MFEFLWYCIKCMAGALAASTGNVQDDFTWADGLVGVATFCVLAGVFLAILYFTRIMQIVNFKKKDKNKEKYFSLDIGKKDNTELADEEHNL